MSPTVFREGPFRFFFFFFFFFFSREEPRMHVHVQTADGEAKFWLEAAIELARHDGLDEQDIARARELTTERAQEIRDA